MNKTRGWSDAAHPPMSFTTHHYCFIILSHFLLLALHGNYGQKWFPLDELLCFYMRERKLCFIKIYLYLSYSCLEQSKSSYASLSPVFLFSVVSKVRITDWASPSAWRIKIEKCSIRSSSNFISKIGIILWALCALIYSTRFFIRNAFFSTQLLCCLIIYGIEP